MAKNSIQWQLENFKVPRRYKSIHWNDLVHLSATDKDVARKYISDFPSYGKESLYLSGGVSGTGKTAFSICLARDLIKSGKLNTYSLFIPYVILMDQLRQDLGAFTESSLFKHILGASFLILDDIGVEKLNRSTSERYYLLLEHLWLGKKPVIFTSKFTINQLLERADDTVDLKLLDSIGSRFVGMCKEVELSNERDFRDRD